MIVITGYEIDEKLCEGERSLIFRAHRQKKQSAGRKDESATVIIKILKEKQMMKMHGRQLLMIKIL